MKPSLTVGTATLQRKLTDGYHWKHLPWLGGYLQKPNQDGSNGRHYQYVGANECDDGRRCRSPVQPGQDSHAHNLVCRALLWGKLYTGIPNSKAQRTQVEDTTGFVEGRSTVDARLAEVEPNLNAFRLQEAQAYLEAMSQEHQRAVIYESQDSSPEKITGLAPRFSSLSAENGSQIVDGGGTGSDNTSVWFITWGLDSCHLIYPEGTSGGLIREDHGKQRVLDGSGNAYYAFEETFRMHSGVAVRDWRKLCARG